MTGANQYGTATTYLGSGQGRCGYGPRLPLLLISPWAKANYVDHTLTDLSSILRFIEDNWLQSERIPDSADAKAGSLTGLFDFARPHGEPPNAKTFLLNPTTGQPLVKSS